MMIRPKLCGNCAFPQKFHTRKLGEIMVFFTVIIITWDGFFFEIPLKSSWIYFYIC